MKVEKCYCDRCHKEIPIIGDTLFLVKQEPPAPKIELRVKARYSLTQSPLDLCEDCTLEWINQAIHDYRKEHAP